MKQTIENTKNIIKFLALFLYSRVLNLSSLTTIIPIIFVGWDFTERILEGVYDIGYLLILETVIFILFILFTKGIYFGFYMLFLSKKNKNAGIFRGTHSFTMLSNKRLRGIEQSEIERILGDDYKEILDYGLNKYPNGIKITTHSLVVQNLTSMGYGTRAEYRNCKLAKTSIIKEKFHMLTFRQFLRYIKAIANPDNEYHIEANKYLKPRNRYKFIIRRDSENNIIVESN